MGARKRISAEKRKEENKSPAVAALNNCPTSPRKMRLVVDMIRGVEVNRALDILRYQHERAFKKMWKSFCFQPLPTGRRRMKMCGSRNQTFL